MGNVVLLVPAEMRWRQDEAVDRLGNYAVHVVPDDGCERARYPVAQPMDFSAWNPRAKVAQALEFVIFDRYRFGNCETTVPNERRRRARRGRRGRRGARSVPMAQRWDIDIFATADTPGDIKLRAASMVMVPPSVRVWRCPFWRRGADVWARGMR